MLKRSVPSPTRLPLLSFSAAFAASRPRAPPSTLRNRSLSYSTAIRTTAAKAPEMAAAFDPSSMSAPLVNRCLDSKSPYVRSHANNPTAWQLWTPETIELARRTNKLLFVSIGYSACHWCHVMAHESFDHPGIAKLINTHFIPIKIDREERPDIDRVYMDFLQATTGGGGWPLNVFVTPELQPLFGGTYWPGPGNEQPGRGGSFETILEKVAEAWQTQESKCREDARRITSQLEQFAQEGKLNTSRPNLPSDADSELPDLEILEDAYEYFRMRYDPKYGGFGGAPKFPTPAHLTFLLRLGLWSPTIVDIIGDEEILEARDIGLDTLVRMAAGAIKDQIGNGFSRYSVTRDWSLPHFEKMLYDNAQLLNAFVDAYLITDDERALETVHDIATYLTSDLIQGPTGGFNASEDADSAPTFSSTEHKEGAFYVWSLKEFNAVIGNEKEALIAADYFNVKAEGNVEARHDVQGELEGLNALHAMTNLEDLAYKHSVTENEVLRIVDVVKPKLLAYRNANRPRPHLDDKIVVAWNGLAISALARTSTALTAKQPELAAKYYQSAARAAEFIYTSLYSSSTKTLLRVYREGPGNVPGFADDYAFLIAGLLDLYHASFDERWLQWAYELQETQLSLFFDYDKAGGFFSTAKDSQDVIIRSKDAMDNAEPSVNGVSAMNLFKLGALLKGARPESSTAGQTMEQLAIKTVKAFEVEMGQHPGLMSGLLAGVIISRMGMKSVLLSGSGPLVDEALKVLREDIWPGVVVMRIPEGGAGDWLKSKNETLAALDPSKELVQLCLGTSCSLAQRPGDLYKLLSED